LVQEHNWVFLGTSLNWIERASVTIGANPELEAQLRPR